VALLTAHPLQSGSIRNYEILESVPFSFLKKKLSFFYENPVSGLARTLLRFFPKEFIYTKERD
jgi:hypothetical protein